MDTQTNLHEVTTEIQHPEHGVFYYLPFPLLLANWAMFLFFILLPTLLGLHNASQFSTTENLPWIFISLVFCGASLITWQAKAWFGFTLIFFAQINLALWF